MMEQAHAGEGHGHAVFVGSRDDIVVAGGAAGFEDVLHTGLGSAVDAVAEGEEGVRAEGDAGQRIEPGAALVGGQLGREWW